MITVVHFIHGSWLQQFFLSLLNNCSYSNSWIMVWCVACKHIKPLWILGQETSWGATVWQDTACYLKSVNLAQRPLLFTLLSIIKFSAHMKHPESFLPSRTLCKWCLLAVYHWQLTTFGLCATFLQILVFFMKVMKLNYWVHFFLFWGVNPSY